MVLCVGSHEPRKNHGAVVHAADRLWRAGLEFQLVFIGGNSWGNADTAAEIKDLIEAGRPLTIVSKPSDALLWSAYALATVSVFPSINEGFGLPVAESLAMGTPVVTSNYGSMAEIASQGGCLLVDPRDDVAIAAAIERILTDPTERERLSTEALARNNSSWAQYSQDLWDSFPTNP
jgi:glycosyltransferase involved in cell wall biosynthesis